MPGSRSLDGEDARAGLSVVELRAMNLKGRGAMVELASRFRRVSGIDAFRATLFQKQREVLGCSARKIAVLCTRRAGKTTMVPTSLFDAAEGNPGCVILFIGNTRIRAKHLAWANLVKANDEYSLGYAVNISELTLSHPTNGSVIRLYGATDGNVAGRIRGDKVALAVIDEAQHIADRVLVPLVNEVLWPALLDVSGTLMLMGTPGRSFTGLWYDVTRNESAASTSERARGWVVYEWSGLDNPSVNHKGQRISELFAAEIRAIEEDPERGPGDPSLVREFKGRWCEGGNDLFYKFERTRNTWAGGALPRGHAWRYGMGVDLGGPFAIVVLAYSETHPIIFEVDGLKEVGTNANHWKAMTKTKLAQWEPDFCVVDYGGLGGATIRAWQEDGLMVEPAEKSNKAAYVSLLNGELEEGKVKALVDGDLATEWANLPEEKDTPPGKAVQPMEGFDDHSADAALYAWRKAYRFIGVESRPSPEPGSREAQEQWNDAEKDRAIQRSRGEGWWME